MSKNPTFSVLMANYNNGHYLEESIESVKAQTYKHWEIILVDDASTDNSLEILEACKNDNRIKQYKNKTNRGCGYTKKKCAELAKGELCGYLDPDDTLEPDALEIMVKHHKTQHDAALICSRHNFCDVNLNVSWVSQIMDKRELDYLTQRFHKTEHFASFKKAYYDETPGLNPTFKRAVDQDLYYLLEEQGKMIFIDDILYNYRLHGSNISSGHYKALYWHILAAKAAAERRGLEPEEVVDNILTDLLQKYETKYTNILQSNYYSLGFKLLRPFEKLKRKVNKILS